MRRCAELSPRARARVCVVQRRTNRLLPNAKDFSEWRKRSELHLIRGKRACIVARWQFVSTAPAHRTQLASGAVPARRQTASSAHHRRRRWLHLLQGPRCRPTDRPTGTFCTVLSRPRSDGWPHHGRTFSIYLGPLSF